jgi:hypothetical protein
MHSRMHRIYIELYHYAPYIHPTISLCNVYKSNYIIMHRIYIQLYRNATYIHPIISSCNVYTSKQLRRVYKCQIWPFLDWKIWTFMLSPSLLLLFSSALVDVSAGTYRWAKRVWCSVRRASQVKQIIKYVLFFVRGCRFI